MSEPLDETAADSPSASSRALARGETVGKYRLERVLGSGGMGVVWAAHDPDLDRQVALKLLRAADANVAQRTRLLREARAMAKLKHPNVLTVYEVGSERDRDYISMELVDGHDLDQWLETRPPRRDVLAAVFAAGRGLVAAHDAGLVHRDFKPHNVLRDRDGRVLVTDFGLARGVVDPEGELQLEPPRPIPATPVRKSDPVLDSTLTQTGAMIGTPAYMAPEQFEGAAPDPRTDQFAFCVTAWQALTGERPHSGLSLAELRRVAKSEAHAGASKLPRALRRVLERGLAADPQQRWPDMRRLLRELEQSQQRPRAIIAILAATALVAGATVAGISILRDRAHAPALPADACNETFDAAWSPATRAGLARRLVDGGYTDATPRWFDGLRTRWTDALARTCADREQRTFHARLGCLLGARDQVASIADLLQQLPIGEAGQFDVFGLAPPLSACTTDAPPTPPAMPAQRATRERIAALHARAYALRDVPPSSLESAVKQLESDARDIGWPPLVAQLLYGAEVAARRAEQWKLARELIQRAAMEAAASRDPATEAQARIDRYELSITVAENPRDAFELDRLAQEARVALRAAGDDPLQRAALDMLEAHVAVLQDDPERALGKAALASHQTFVAAGDVHRAVLATRWLVDAYTMRGLPGDLEAADALIESTRKGLAVARLSAAEGSLDRIMATVETHRTGPKVKPSSGFIVGLRPFDRATTPAMHVVDPSGQPSVAEAWVWDGTGDHFGMPRSPATIMSIDARGSLTVDADGVVVLAQHDELRSPVTEVADGATLRLGPTRTITGKIIPSASSSLPSDVDACMMFALPHQGAWVFHGAAARDGSFTLAGVPPGDGQLCATDSVRRVLAKNGVLRWPVTSPLDVIVRGSNHDVQVWVFRGDAHPRTRAQAEALALRAADVATDMALIIGQGDATAAGRERYAPDDRHAVIKGNAEGTITACAARDDKLDAQVECNRHEMGAHADALVIATAFQ